MSQRSRFFDAVGDPPDITYGASAMAQVFKSLFPTDGVVSGLRPSAQSPAAMAVDVSIGHAWVQGRYVEVYASAEALTISANASGNPRVDSIVVRLDYAARTGTIAVLEGTPAASPAAPTLTQNSTTWEHRLANVAVANGASSIGSSDITDVRDWVGSPRPADVVFSAQEGAAAPPGWLLADGTLYNRDDYPDLFDVIGDTFDAGDGSTTFGVPDLRGRVLAGLDDLGGSSASRLPDGDSEDVGGTGGEESTAIGVTHLPARQFATKGSGATQVGAFGFGDNWGITTGGGTEFYRTQPYMVMTAAIWPGVDRS